MQTMKKRYVFSRRGPNNYVVSEYRLLASFDTEDEARAFIRDAKEKDEMQACSILKAFVVDSESEWNYLDVRIKIAKGKTKLFYIGDVFAHKVSIVVTAKTQAAALENFKNEILKLRDVCAVDFESEVTDEN